MKILGCTQKFRIHFKKSIRNHFFNLTYLSKSEFYKQLNDT